MGALLRCAGAGNIGQTPRFARIRQLGQQIGDHLVLVLELWAVAITGLAGPENSAS